jgi:hypothetical protein
MAAAHWTLDGSGVLAASGGAVRCVADAAGSKGNAVWGSAGGSGHYAFRLSGPPGAWVGVCTQGGFAAGWRLRGLFFGGPGNLADGSSLVAGGWGPAFGEGDTIGMRVEQGAGAVSLAFSKNGEPLGEAFNVSGWEGGALHPAVSLDTEGQGVELLLQQPAVGAAAAAAAAALPPLAAFLRPAGPASPGIEGSWVGRYSLQVSSAGAGWRLSARVANTMNCRVLAGAGGVSLQGRVSSTLMAPGPEDAALEREVVRALEGITALRREGAELVLEGGGAQERFSAAPAPAPAGKESINWIN